MLSREGARGNAYDGYTRRDIVENDGPRADDRAVSDGHPLDDVCARSDIHAVAERDVARDGGQGVDRDVVAEDGVVANGAIEVQMHVASDSNVVREADAGRHHGSEPELDVGVGGLGMDGAAGLGPEPAGPLVEHLTHARLAHADEIASTRQLLEVVHGAEMLRSQPGEKRRVRAAVVEEAEEALPAVPLREDGASGPKHVERFASESARADDDDDLLDERDRKRTGG